MTDDNLCPTCGQPLIARLPSTTEILTAITGGTGRIVIPLVGRWSMREPNDEDEKG